jgi:hypothetical protein
VKSKNKGAIKMNAKATDLLATWNIKTNVSAPNWLYTMGGIAALIALLINVSDVVLGFGGSEVITYGSQPAASWFATFQHSPFKGLYSLGIFNIAYMFAMLPVYVALLWAHRRHFGVQTALVFIVYLLATAIYASTNAAIPMFVLWNKYALAQTELQKTIFLAAGEAILARGEDFTPGTFIGFFLSGCAAITVSVIMLCGGIFGKRNAWIGIIGFTFLSLFTFFATFVPTLYTFSFYFFGSIGGILALTWFALTSRRLFQLGAHEKTNAIKVQS